jgi:hypothetical protein
VGLLTGSVIGTVLIAGSSPMIEERSAPFLAEFQIRIPADYDPPVPGPLGTAYQCTIDP